MRFVLLLLGAAITSAGCSRSDWKPDTRWHEAALNETNVTWDGSYQNALDTLQLRSHAWKLIDYNAKTDRCEWGFKAVVEFKGDAGNKKTTKFGDAFFMPINKIEYELYDRDGFRLTSLSLPESAFAASTKLGIAEHETKTFQHAGVMSPALARRAAFGRLRIQAGYAYPKTFVPDASAQGRNE